MDSAGIDYHVMLAANAIQQCLDIPDLQPELLCALIKQTSRPTHAKHGVQVKRNHSNRQTRVSSFVSFISALFLFLLLFSFVLLCFVLLLNQLFPIVPLHLLLDRPGDANFSLALKSYEP